MTSPPHRPVALFQHGWGVEFMDLPQAVVVGADADVYRRVDLAEDRAGPYNQGDPGPMLLSPDGTSVALGQHDSGRPDLAVLDLATGEVTRYPVPGGRSVVPLAWSRDARLLAYVLSDTATSTTSGTPPEGDVGVLDLAGGDGPDAGRAARDEDGPVDHARSCAAGHANDPATTCQARADFAARLRTR